MEGKSIIPVWQLSVILSSLLFIQMCDSDSTDPGNQELTINVAGSWELTTQITSNTFGLQNGETNTEFIYLTDSSGVVSITNFNGHWGNGIVNGKNIHFTGTEVSDDFDTTATLVTEGTGSISETEIVGTLTTEVYINHVYSNNNPEGMIASSFTMVKLEETTCYDRAIFGDPEESEYILPFPVGSAYPIYQSYCWCAGGHRNQLAYDFTIPIGDTIVAARDGVVREVQEDSPDNGQGYGEHNRVYIQHEDGTAAVYAHLMQNSVIVEPGDIVKTGQFFAFSGNSGESDVPHLHFGVYENYPPVEGLDVPVNFRNAEGPLDNLGGLIRGAVYKALPY
jgi:murein DD-endopeptidase MepM/ murein hydrolase activator NlpD